MTDVTQLTDNDVALVKKDAKKGKISTHNYAVNTSMYYDSQGVIYKVNINNRASVFAYAPGIVGKSQKLSIITIPLFITYDNTSTLRVISIEANAFTDASRYFGLKSVKVPERITISANSGIPVKQRITPNTSVTSLTRFSRDDILYFNNADVKAIAKKAAKVAAPDKVTFDNVTVNFSSRQIPTATRAVLADFKAGKDKSIPTVVVNPRAYEMAVAKNLSQGAHGSYIHSNLGYLLATDVDGVTGYTANVAEIASDARTTYADGIAAANKPVPAGLTDRQASAWNQSQTEMAISAKVVFDETTLWLENSDTSDSVVTALNNMKVALETAQALLKTEGFDRSDLVALDKQIAAIAGLDEKIETAALSALTPEAFARFTPAQVAVLTPVQTKALTPAQVAVLTPAQVAVLTPAQVAVLTPVQIKAFAPEQVAALTPAQIKALTTPQIKALRPDQVASLTTDQINALSSTQVSNPPSKP